MLMEGEGDGETKGVTGMVDPSPAATISATRIRSSSSPPLGGATALL